MLSFRCVGGLSQVESQDRREFSVDLLLLGTSVEVLLSDSSLDIQIKTRGASGQDWR